MPLSRPATRPPEPAVLGVPNEGAQAAPSRLAAPATEAVRALARATRLLERSCAEMSLAHFRVLAAIDSGDERASRIARKLAIGKPTISACVEALCQKGLLARSGVEGDQRGAALHLTAEGKAVLGRAEREMSAWLEALCARAPEGAKVPDALVVMGQLIEQVAAERHSQGG